MLLVNYCCYWKLKKKHTKIKLWASRFLQNWQLCTLLFFCWLYLMIKMTLGFKSCVSFSNKLLIFNDKNKLNKSQNIFLKWVPIRKLKHVFFKFTILITKWLLRFVLPLRFRGTKILYWSHRATCHTFTIIQILKPP